jgi:hypothetical protein
MGMKLELRSRGIGVESSEHTIGRGWRYGRLTRHQRWMLRQRHGGLGKAP